MQQSVVRLSTWNEAKDALRHRDVRQGLYDEGSALMDGVIVNLHGNDHLARRRLENRLFRRDTFLQWEQHLIPQLINDVFNQLDDPTEGDMVQIARRTMMRLSSLVAGIDLGADLASFEKMSGLMSKLAAASTVVHATGDKDVIINEGNTALDTFLAEYFASSRQRREHLIAQAKQGELEWSDLPADVLTVLLTNQDNLDLPDNDHHDPVERAYIHDVATHMNDTHEHPHAHDEDDLQEEHAHHDAHATRPTMEMPHISLDLDEPDTSNSPYQVRIDLANELWNLGQLHTSKALMEEVANEASGADKEKALKWLAERG